MGLAILMSGIDIFFPLKALTTPGSSKSWNSDAKHAEQWQKCCQCQCQSIMLLIICHCPWQVGCYLEEKEKKPWQPTLNMDWKFEIAASLNVIAAAAGNQWSCIHRFWNIVHSANRSIPLIFPLIPLNEDNPTKVLQSHSH